MLKWPAREEGIQHMIRKIRGLYTRIKARIIPAREVAEKQINAKTMVHRRVEVTVERETVSILVPGQPAVAPASSRQENEAGKMPALQTTAPRPPRTLKP